MLKLLVVSECDVMISLTPRLQAVADMVKTDSITDVGTDHGKLPVYLALSGKIVKAIASDLNDGPLKGCMLNVDKFGLSDIIDVRLSNGLNNFRLSETKTLCIAGMGGELMSNILLKDIDIARGFDEIILQPMTQIEHLKAFLYDSGFSLLDEVLVAEGDKLYDIFKVKYTGEQKSYTQIELLVSDVLIDKKDFLLYKYTEKIIKRYKNILNGLKNSDIVDEKQYELYNDLLCEVKKINEIAKTY